MDNQELNNQFWDLVIHDASELAAAPIAIDEASRDVEVRLLASLAFRDKPITDGRRQAIAEKVMGHYGLNAQQFDEALLKSFMARAEKGEAAQDPRGDDDGHKA